VEYEPAVLLAGTAMLGQQKSLLSDNCQSELLLNEMKVFPKLHFIGDEEACGDV
jgi:hypothetical protein